jgi:hypothetical protein
MEDANKGVYEDHCRGGKLDLPGILRYNSLPVSQLRKGRFNRPLTERAEGIVNLLRDAGTRQRNVDNCP